MTIEQKINRLQKDENMSVEEGKELLCSILRDIVMMISNKSNRHWKATQSRSNRISR